MIGPLIPFKSRNTFLPAGHDMGAVLTLASHIWVQVRGRIIAAATLACVRADAVTGAA